MRVVFVALADQTGNSIVLALLIEIVAPAGDDSNCHPDAPLVASPEMVQMILLIVTGMLGVRSESNIR